MTKIQVNYMVTILCNIPDVFLLFLSHVSEVSKDNETREDTGDAVDWRCNETIPAKCPQKDLFNIFKV